jgi:hypothetical protein
MYYFPNFILFFVYLYFLAISYVSRISADHGQEGLELTIRPLSKLM